MTEATIEFSVSTWQQPMPPPAGPTRARVLDGLVGMIDSLGSQRVSAQGIQRSDGVGVQVIQQSGVHGIQQ